MIIPMEMLSLMTKTDSGQNTRQNSTSEIDSGKRFEQILERSQTVAKPPAANGRKPDFTNGRGNAKAAKAIEDMSNQDSDEAAKAAGTMGISKNIVFILEGNTESVDDLEAYEGNVILEGVESGLEKPVDGIGEKGPSAQAKPEAPPQADRQPDPSGQITSDDVKHAEIAPNAKITDNEANAKNTRPEIPKDTSDESKDTGAIMARKPIMRTRELSEAGNEEQGSKFSGNGAPCPFENENDGIPKNTRNEKTFADTARSREADSEQKADGVPMPLSEGISPERFQAGQQMKQAVHSPVAAENLFDEMISRIEMAQTDSRQTMTIQLKPEFLGKVALEVAVDAAGLHVKINAADPGVRGMINGQLTALIESLENKGIQVVEVDVAYPGVNYGDLKDPRGGHQPEAGRHKRARPEARIEGADYNALPMSEKLEHYLDIGMSTVEYSA